MQPLTHLQYMAILGSVGRNEAIDFVPFREYVHFEVCVVPVKKKPVDTDFFSF